MELNEAMKVFDITDRSCIDTEAIKKVYRSKAKKFHPDVSEDIDKMVVLNCAKEILENYILTRANAVDTIVEEKNKQTVLIKIEDLGTAMDIGYMVDGTMYTFNRLLYKFNVFIVIGIELIVNNNGGTVVHNVSDVVEYRLTGKYEIEVNYSARVNEDVSIRVLCNGVEKCMDTKYSLGIVTLKNDRFDVSVRLIRNII